MTKSYKYIYGPVPSWRLGSSLGIDPLSKNVKACTLDCVYCQLGRTGFLTDKRRDFVQTAEIMEELNSLPALEIDYITFSGTGEPTLAENIGEMIRKVKKARKGKIAVLTNSSLLDSEDVQKDLFPADFVVVKLDAPTDDVFESVNHPLKTIKLGNMIQAIKDFRSRYAGRLALQVMFIERNKKYAPEIVEIAKDINPDEIQLNTPLRPCRVKPLTKPEMDIVKAHFDGLNVISVYDTVKKTVKAISSEDTLRRRGKV